ncbi:MAG TPA: hypothetical protein VFT88_01600 [Acidobacteriaceae bacterium]|jgi:hypothetical protein|nr:hypothetical protein [Acidobacteriaceae bacterium]
MIHVRLKPEVEAALAAEAQARGMALDRYLEEIVATRNTTAHEDRSERKRAIEAMMQFARKHSLQSGGQSIKDMLHEGHKY